MYLWAMLWMESPHTFQARHVCRFWSEHWATMQFWIGSFELTKMIDWASDWEDQLLFRFFRACQFFEAWQIHTKFWNFVNNQEIQDVFVLHWISKSCMKIKSKWQIFWLSFFILFTEGFWHPKDLWNLEECNQNSRDNAEDWCYHAMMPTAPVSCQADTCAADT